MHTVAIAETGYRNLPLSMLDESSTNPRRTFEPAKLQLHELNIGPLVTAAHPKTLAVLRIDENR